MDRFYYVNFGDVLGDVITSCKGIRLYDGDKKVRAQAVTFTIYFHLS